MNLIVTKTIKEEYHIPNGNSLYELKNSLTKDKEMYKEFEMCKISTTDNIVRMSIYENNDDTLPVWTCED